MNQDSATGKPIRGLLHYQVLGQLNDLYTASRLFNHQPGSNGFVGILPTLSSSWPIRQCMLFLPSLNAVSGQTSAKPGSAIGPV